MRQHFALFSILYTYLNSFATGWEWKMMFCYREGFRQIVLVMLTRDSEVSRDINNPVNYMREVIFIFDVAASDIMTFWVLEIRGEG
jgi:hypothetical protein